MNIEQEIINIKKRNRRVEADKAWETSWMRYVILAILTYIVVVIFFHFSGVASPWVNSIEPAVGLMLSALGLQFFRRFWQKYFYKRK
jgi:hypothetical protein